MIEGISDILGFPPVKFGFGAIRELAGLSIERGMARPLIITDKGLVEHGVLKKLIDAQPANFSFVVFDDIPPNPTVAGILAAADVYKAEGCDGIIGLGGGSVLDSGKALRVAVSHPGPFISYLKPDAKIGPGCHIGEFCVVESDVEIGMECRLEPYVYVKRWTTMGDRNEISAGTALGTDPLDKGFTGERSYLRMGSGNRIREHYTISRGTEPESVTLIGDDNYAMTSGHIAHNGDFLIG